MDDNDRRYEYTSFRRKLTKTGFYQLQYSIYVKVVPNEQAYKSIVKQIKTFVPKYGNVRIIKITEKQYESMVFLRGKSNLHETVIGDNEIVMFASNEMEDEDE